MGIIFALGLVSYFTVLALGSYSIWIICELIERK